MTALLELILLLIDREGMERMYNNQKVSLKIYTTGKSIADSIMITKISEIYKIALFESVDLILSSLFVFYLLKILNYLITSLLCRYF